MKLEPKRDARRLAVVIGAALIMAININTFVSTGGLYPGGATGLALLLQRIFLRFLHLHIPYAAINIAVNAVPVFIGFRFIGRKFTLFSLIMILANSFFVDLLPTYALTYDILLISIFGGLINGLCISMCLIVDATSGGTDFISIYLSQKTGMDSFNVILAFNVALLVAAYITLYKTKFGLRLMACGEHPQAADSVGINVYKMRWAGVLISGMLGGLGGIVFITAGVSEWRFEYGVAGFGFLALAVMIFGQWKPTRIALAALLFGLFRALSNVYMGFNFLANLNIPSQVYNMMPYVISLVVLAFTSKKSRAPKAEGIPYDKGQR